MRYEVRDPRTFELLGTLHESVVLPFLGQPSFDVVTMKRSMRTIWKEGDALMGSARDRTLTCRFFKDFIQFNGTRIPFFHYSGPRSRLRDIKGFRIA